jgi:hypothetical protein
MSSLDPGRDDMAAEVEKALVAIAVAAATAEGNNEANKLEWVATTGQDLLRVGKARPGGDDGPPYFLHVTGGSFPPRGMDPSGFEPFTATVIWLVLARDTLKMRLGVGRGAEPIDLSPLGDVRTRALPVHVE